MSSSNPTETAVSNDNILSQSVTRRVVGGLRGWVQENWQNTVVDVQQLPRQLRYLTIFGYGGALVMLATVLVFAVLGPNLPQVQYQDVAQGSTLTLTVPSLVLYITTLCTILGWALILTGASDCSRRVFVLVLAMYVIQWFSTVPDQVDVLSFWGALDFLALGAVFLSPFIFAFTRRFRFWTQYPLAEFGFWAVIVTIHMADFWNSSSSASEVAAHLHILVQWQLLFGIPFWFWLGIDAADLIKETTYAITARTQHYFSAVWIRRLVPLWLFVEFFVALGFILPTQASVNTNIATMFVLLTIPVLVVVASILALARRWTLRAALVVFWISVVALLYGVFLMLTLQGSDVNEVVLGIGGLIPPAFIFTLLMFYDVATFGTRAANQDGTILPRSGRLLLYLGAILLVGGFSLFVMNVNDVATGTSNGNLQPLINAATLFGFLFVGPFYLAHSLWKSRHELVTIHSAPVAADIVES